MQVPTHPFLVAKLTPLVSGVDFLGLGAVNERLIADFLPGISNVTRYMRVYSAMTWLAWRFDRHFERAGGRLTVGEIKRRFNRYREKVELLFTWGNLGNGPGIVGSQREFPRDGAKRRLAFSEFGSVTISWLDAAVYGPSLRSDNGLRFLEPRPGGALGPTQRGVELAEALDAGLQRSRYYRQLCDVEDDVGSVKMAKDLSEHWSVLTSTKRERTVFSEAFAPSRSLPEQHSNEAARSAAVRLIHAALTRLGGIGTVKAVREAIARGVDSKGAPLAASQDEPARALWTALQVRQLQRLCHEMLLRWVEMALMEAPADLKGLSTAQLARYCGDVAARHLGLSADRPLSDVIALIVGKVGRRGSPLLAGGSVDPFLAMEQLLGLPYAQVLERAPGLALRGLAIAAVQAVALANDSDFSGPFALGRGDRLSVQTLIDLFESYQGRSIADFVEMLIESCTVGQHFATAASRLEPGKNKYRFVPSEHGLEPLFDPDKVLRVDVTPDRLGTAMSLMRDCGLLSRTADPDVFGLPK